MVLAFRSKIDLELDLRFLVPNGADDKVLPTLELLVVCPNVELSLRSVSKCMHRKASDRCATFELGFANILRSTFKWVHTSKFHKFVTYKFSQSTLLSTGKSITFFVISFLGVFVVGEEQADSSTSITTVAISPSVKIIVVADLRARWFSVSESISRDAKFLRR
jgi:hypothetical protein